MKIYYWFNIIRRNNKAAHFTACTVRCCVCVFVSQCDLDGTTARPEHRLPDGRRHAVPLLLPLV